MDPSPRRFPAWLPYAFPFALFLALTAAEGLATDAEGKARPDLYPWLYAAKIALVAASAVIFRSAWRDFRPWPTPPQAAWAVALGIVVAVVWVALDGWSPALPGSGGRSAFDPNALAPGPRALFVAIRFLGLVAVVPLIEELFWRSFLMRWCIDADFEKVPVGAVTPLAALITSAAFALAHPEWVPALLTGLAWSALLWKTRSLGACLISHAIANLILGAYVVYAGAWRFW
jgi:CAAX prenyl protease-like protein